GGCERPGDRPVVAADRRAVSKSPIPNPKSQISMDHVIRDSCFWRLDVESWRVHSWRTFGQRQRRTSRAARAKIVNIRPGNRRRAEAFANDGCIPLGSLWREELEHRLWQDVVHGPERRLVRT